MRPGEGVSQGGVLLAVMCRVVVEMHRQMFRAWCQTSAQASCIVVWSCVVLVRQSTAGHGHVGTDGQGSGGIKCMAGMGIPMLGGTGVATRAWWRSIGMTHTWA